MATYYCRLTDEYGHTDDHARPVDVPDTEFVGRHGKAARAAEKYAQQFDNEALDHPPSREVVVRGPVGPDGKGGAVVVYEVELAMVPEYTARPVKKKEVG